VRPGGETTKAAAAPPLTGQCAARPWPGACRTEGTGPLLRPNGHMAVTTEQHLGSTPCGDRGTACRSTPASGLTQDAFLETGGIWLVRLVPGTRGKRLGRDPSHKTRVPVPASRNQGVSDTPPGICGYRRRFRYEWSWPEPPAGATPCQRRSRRALARTGACGQPGSRTANRMAASLSPSIRQRACPARLRPA
jgi:hypothetical protein